MKLLPLASLGQGSVLQENSFEEVPKQLLPPFRAGLDMILVFNLVPPPHFSEHLVQAPHELHSQSTGTEGQGSALQACISVDDGKHGAPPCLACCDIILDRSWTPPSQVLVQAPHSAHWLHAQSTEG